MLLVVGLGNPGPDYAGNRHNIGFMAADAIQQRQGLSPFRAKFQGELCEGRVGTSKILVLKPQTYMNRSGDSVAQVCAFFKIEPEDVIVLHDELDLEAGRLRLKEGGGHAGHNGLRSIHAHLGSEYRRLRFGIGHPGDKSKVTSHVLKDFARADSEWLETLLDTTADAFPLLIEGKGSEFMNKVSQAMAPFKAPPEGKEESEK